MYHGLHKLGVKLLVRKSLYLALFIPLLWMACTLAMGEDDANARLWNLNNVDLKNVIEAVSRETGRNFLVDPRVSGKVNMISSRPMNSDEIYQLFLSVLQVSGYGAIEVGDVTKIIPISEARHLTSPVASMTKPGVGDELVVQVIPVHNISAAKLVPILRPLIPETGNIAAYDAANALIVSGTADSIMRLIHIIRDVDKADTNELEFINLTQATASSVVNVLNSLQSANPDPSSKVMVAADEHTNSIILGGDRTTRLRMRVLVSQLDSPTPAAARGNTQVINLHYLKAKDLAPILSKMIQGSDEEGNAKKADNRNISVEAEPTTNALIVTAPPAIMSTIKHVVDKLDKRPAQVLVEAAIVEVNERALNQLGIQWGQLIDEGNAVDPNDTIRLGNGLPSGFAPGIGVIKSGDFRGLVHFLATDDATNILSTPSIMVMDNQQAKIEVGKTLSIETGSYANSDGVNNSVTPFTTFERDNIGLHLYVTPQINRGNAVQLEIDQGNESLENPVDPTTTPITNVTSIQTTVLVNNGDILVLGGLLSNGLNLGDFKLPFLGDIPIAGYLFKLKSRRFEKKNLMIFLKPTIVRNSKDVFDLTDPRYNFIRNDQIRAEHRDRFVTAEPEERILPPWQQQAPVLPKPFALG